jgi:hypothetical protein
MTPAETIVARANEHKVVEDGRGRKLTVRRLGALETLRLFKAAGPVLAENQAWLGMAGLAMSVTAIDGIPLPIPSNEVQIEAAVARLGDDGLISAAAAFDVDSTSDPLTAGEIAGNLQGTLT